VTVAGTLVGMDVRVHHDPSEYWALARPLFAADPMRHTHGLSVVRRLVEAPDPSEAPPMLLSVWDGSELAGAVFRTAPWPMGVSALPGAADQAVASTLLEVDPELSAVSGPREAAERFAGVWSARTGVTVKEVMALRLYRLGELEKPVVRGTARLGTEDDVPLMAGWRSAFEIEAVGRERQPGRAESDTRRSLALGNGMVLWEVDGGVVSFAAVGAPIDGMSRIGPVYTPPEHRGRGYGSAVTAAASQWALDAGAEFVILFTDLANPVSNSIYQRIGYRPVYDQTDLEFGK
jgi:GNAT superfamily N-acetyltransferase